MKLFILLTLGSLAIIFITKATPESLKAIIEFKKGYLFLAFLLSGMDFLLGGLRIYVFFTKKILKKVSLWNCCRANLANMFVAAVTPTQTGGGPAQLYILNRSGAPLSGAMSVSIINFFSSLFFFLISVLFISVALPKVIIDLKIDHIVRYGIVIIGLVLVSLVFLIIKPESLNWLFRKLTKFSGYIWKRNKGNQISHKITEQVTQFKDYLHLFLTKEKPTLFLSFLITVILYFNKYLIAYVIVRGLNLSPNLWDVFYLQTLQFFLLYFSPTPGSSGAAEVSSIFLMSKLVPFYQLPVFVVLWRFFVTFMGVAFGGWITVKDLNKFFKEKQMQIENLSQEPQLVSLD
ncbi:MAG: flippase-like domain-containing protein [candidate division Zixibacteria bacterium]|nr:flippase-like domain-containing protein [candidate division Zixibacteria bacterium]